MTRLAPATRFTGEITERAELLNGAMQLALDGEAANADPAWTIESALSWRLGRSGAVTLDEGDLTLEAGAHELVAVLDHGTAELDPDTGGVEIEATFTVEGVSGVDPPTDGALSARFEIGAESWTGELLEGLPADEAD